MKVVLSFWLAAITWLFIGLPVQGQSLASARKVYQKGQFEKAATLYRQAIVGLKQAGNWDTLVVARRQLAHTCLKTTEYEAANLQLDSAFREWSRHFPQNFRLKSDLIQEQGNAAQEQFLAADAFRFHREALRLRKAYKSSPVDVAASLEGVGMDHFFFENDLDSAQWYITQALELRKQHLLPTDPDLGYTHNTLGMFANRRFDPIEALSHYLEAERLLTPILDAAHPNWVYLYTNIGGMFTEKGDFQQALVYLHRALRLAKEPRQQYILYFNLAGVYISTGDLETASSFAGEAYRIGKDYLPESDPRRANLENLLGTLALDQLQVKSSLFHYRKALSISQQLTGDNAADLGQCYFNLSTAYKATGNADSAQYFIQLSARIRKKELGTANSRTGDSYGEWAGQLQEKGEKQRAASLYQQCLGMYQESLPATHPHIAWCRARLALICLQENKLEEGLITVKEGWKPFLSAQSASLPLPGNLPASAYYLDLYLVHGQLLYADYEATGSVTSLLLCLDVCKQGVAFVHRLRQQIGGVASTSALMADAKPLIDLGMQAAYAQYALTCEEIWVELALTFAAENKAVILTDALRYSQALHFSGIPDSLVQAEYKLRGEMTFLEQRLLAGDGVAATDQMQLFRTRQDYQALQSQLKSQYPRFFALRYQPVLASITRSRTFLERVGGSLVEYYPTDAGWFALVVTRDTAVMLKLGAFAGLSDTLTALQTSMEADDPRRFAAISRRLYQQFWEPLAPLLHTRQVFIIPGGQISYLSFDLLLGSDPGQTRNWGDWDYLLHRHTLSYAYSTPLLIDPVPAKKEGKTRSLLAISPGFGPELKQAYTLACKQNCDTAYYFRLRQPWALETSQALAASWKGDALLGAHATEYAYKNQATAYRVLHFGTHAEVNDSLPLQSYLALALPDGREDGYLHTSELYNLDLNTRLAVLTACQTGKGSLQEGEGVLSLAWGFWHAGCPALVMSLWSIDDRQSAAIIAQFYRGLQRSLPKNEALQQAKSSFLKSAGPSDANPYYWAGLVLSGDVEPLEKDRDYRALVAVALATLALAGWFVFKKKHAS